MESTILNNKRICCVCGSDKTRKQCGGKYDSWKSINGKVACHDCANEYYRQTNRKFRQIKFCNRVITLSFKIKKGICSSCNQKRITQMHHYMGYWIIFPWFGTVELCVSCHSRTIERDWHGRYFS